MLKIYTKETPSLRGAATNERAGNLEFKVTKINGVEYLYFRIGKTVAQRAGLKAKDRVVMGADPDTGFGVLKPGPKGWVLQSGDLSSEEPPLVLRVTRKKEHPYLAEMGVCTEVKATGNSLEFFFPKGTEFEEGEPEEISEVYREHEALVTGKKRKTRKDEPKRNGCRVRDGKPYGRRATDH